MHYAAEDEESRNFLQVDNGNPLIMTASVPPATALGLSGDDPEAQPTTALADIIQQETNLDNAAIDSILNLNSFFTVAIFIGISSNSSTPQLAPGIDSAQCHPVSTSVPQLVLLLEVLAFGCLLTSTLFAVGLKVMINLNTNRPSGVPQVKEELGRGIFKVAMLVSVMGLIAGMILLVLSMVYYVEVYAGPFHCSPWAAKSIVSLVVFTTLGVLFILLVLFMFVSWFYYVRLGTVQMQKLQTLVRLVRPRPRPAS